MHLNINVDLRDHSSCTLFYNDAEGWLQAVWQGHVDPSEAHWGAQSYLEHAGRIPSQFLLNDNSQLQGPWFESLEWLAEVWVPRAARLGLRYLAHVVQADQPRDILAACPASGLPFELQIFQDPAAARRWLCEMGRAHGQQVPDLLG